MMGVGRYYGVHRLSCLYHYTKPRFLKLTYMIVVLIKLRNSILKYIDKNINILIHIPIDIQFCGLCFNNTQL